MEVHGNMLKTARHAVSQIKDIQKPKKTHDRLFWVTADRPAARATVITSISFLVLSYY